MLPRLTTLYASGFCRFSPLLALRVRICGIATIIIISAPPSRPPKRKKTQIYYTLPHLVSPYTAHTPSYLVPPQNKHATTIPTTTVHTQSMAVRETIIASSLLHTAATHTHTPMNTRTHALLLLFYTPAATTTYMQQSPTFPPSSWSERRNSAISTWPYQIFLPSMHINLTFNGSQK